jgi:hypothetical protein
MTLGSIETFNSAGADGDKTNVKALGALSVAPAAQPIAEALGEAVALAIKAVARAAGRVAAGVVLSRKHVASSDAAVRMTVMLFGFFIRDPFFIANREKL